MEIELRRVVDTLPGLVWTARPDGHIDFFNQRWCEYTGLNVEEARGRGWQAAIHPEDLPELLEHWRSFLASGEPCGFETRLRRFNGEYRWFVFRTCPLVDASGRVDKWCGMNIDIEERRRAEEALRAQERRFRSVVDGFPALVALKTAAGDLEFANRRYLEYFGATREKLKWWAWGDNFHLDDGPEALAAWREAAAWYLLHADLDGRRRAEALLAGEKHLLEMVASGHSMSGILEAVCQLIESTISGCYCSVALVDPSGKRLERKVAPSLPDSFIDPTNGRPVSVDSGPCAMAAYLNEQVIAADLTSETRWTTYAWCQLALAHGLKACWSTPISSTTGKVLGAFAIYYKEPRTPGPREQSLIEQFTHIASIAVERAQSDAALQRSEAFLAQAQHVSSTGSFFWRASTDEIKWSEELYRIFELDPAVPVTLELIFTRLHPEDIPSFQEMLIRQRHEGSDFEHDHRLLLPDNSIKYLQVVARATRDQNDQLEYIATVQDVTQRRLSEEALAKVRSELARVARITSLGALTASIAHEVNQPLSGIITNASTCLRMLSTDPPNIDGALRNRAAHDSRRQPCI